MAGTTGAPTQSGSQLVRLQTFIDTYKKAKGAYENMYLDKMNTVHLFDVYDNFFEDHFKEHMMEVSFTTEEITEYRYNPKMLSTKIYGSPDCWRIVLRSNGLDHPGELSINSGKLKLPDKRALDKLINMYDQLKGQMGGGWLDLKDLEGFK